MRGREPCNDAVWRWVTSRLAHAPQVLQLRACEARAERVVRGEEDQSRSRNQDALARAEYDDDGLESSAFQAHLLHLTDYVALRIEDSATSEVHVRVLDLVQLDPAPKIRRLTDA